MIRICLLSISICMLLFAPLHADITGRIVDNATQPISGAVITSAQTGTKDISKADGTFQLVTSTDNATIPRSFTPLAKSGLQSYTLYTLSGKVLSSWQINDGNAVVHIRNAVREMPAQAFILQIEANGTARRYKAFTIGNSLYLDNDQINRGTNHSVSLAKSAATNDTLIITKSGYYDKRVPVSSSDANLGDIVLNKQDASGTTIQVPSQHATIQAAINAASAGDVIVVADGTYYECLDVNKPVHIKAANPGGAIITNAHKDKVTWTSQGNNEWSASGITWPVHYLMVDNTHCFDFRDKKHFDSKTSGQYWGKAWQKDGAANLSGIKHAFAWDKGANKLYLRLPDSRDPNNSNVEFNSSDQSVWDGSNTTWSSNKAYTVLQQDVGTEQEKLWSVPNNDVRSGQYPVCFKYNSTCNYYAFIRSCQVLIELNADNITIEGFQLRIGWKVVVDANNTNGCAVKDCYFIGYQHAINSGYRCTNFSVTNCEMDGGNNVKTGVNHSNNHMNNHSAFINPILYKGTGLIFQHNFVYQGFDGFHPRGRHKDFSDVPDMQSDVGYNVWYDFRDNALEFDGVNYQCNIRAHHNLIGGSTTEYIAYTTTDKGTLLVDHNLLHGGGRGIFKLSDPNYGAIQFVHNTHISSSSANRKAAFHNANTIFENNIVCSGDDGQDVTPNSYGDFFPTQYNVCFDADGGASWISSAFKGKTANPGLINTFQLPSGSSSAKGSAINKDSKYHHKTMGSATDCGALEAEQTIDDWKTLFGHCGPTWISGYTSDKAPNRPTLTVDKKWGGW